MLNRGPTFSDALKFWFKLGFISFGGPAGQIAIMHEYLVDRKKWISNSKFLHALNYCMLLPGPEAQQLATYIGWLLHGTRGGLAAGILFFLPSMFILLGLSAAYVSYGHLPWLHAIFSGLKPAVIAIVLYALVRIAKKSLKGLFHYCAAIAAFICIFILNIPFPYIIAGAIILGLLSGSLNAGRSLPEKGSAEAEAENEGEYFINRHSVTRDAGFSSMRLFRQVIIAAALWILPLAAFYSLASDFAFWKNISVFFTKAAVVTFGGAYAVLPYVAQVSVEELSWLSRLQMTDGLALGETTPGPLIMVLVFVGFMAGYNHSGSSLLAGTLGLLTTTYYNLLPCFLFIFAGAHLIEKIQLNKKLKDAFSVVSAAIVGVILNLAIYLGMAVLFPDGISLAGTDFTALAWTVLSFIALFRFKVNMIVWIGMSGMFGLMGYLVGGG